MGKQDKYIRMKNQFISGGVICKSLPSKNKERIIWLCLYYGEKALLPFGVVEFSVSADEDFENFDISDSMRQMIYDIDLASFEALEQLLKKKYGIGIDEFYSPYSCGCPFQFHSPHLINGRNGSFGSIK